MERGRWQRQVSVAAGFCENLHFAIDSTAISAGGIGEGKIAVYKCIPRYLRLAIISETSMLGSQSIAKPDELAPRILGGIWRFHPVMQVDLDFAPTGAAVLGQATHQTSIVLLSRIKISMLKRKTLVVAPRTDRSRVVSAPALYPLFLLIVGGTRKAVARNNGWFKMIGHSENQMNRAARKPSC